MRSSKLKGKRLRGKYMVTCPNKKCASVQTVQHHKIDNKHHCNTCRSSFLPREQVLTLVKNAAT